MCRVDHEFLRSEGSPSQVALTGLFMVHLGSVFCKHGLSPCSEPGEPLAPSLLHHIPEQVGHFLIYHLFPVTALVPLCSSSFAVLCRSLSSPGSDLNLHGSLGLLVLFTSNETFCMLSVEFYTDVLVIAGLM